MLLRIMDDGAAGHGSTGAAIMVQDGTAPPKARMLEELPCTQMQADTLEIRCRFLAPSWQLSSCHTPAPALVLDFFNKPLSKSVDVLRILTIIFPPFVPARIHLPILPQSMPHPWRYGCPTASPVVLRVRTRDCRWILPRDIVGIQVHRTVIPCLGSAR